HLHEGRDLLIDLGEPLLAQRLAVDDDPLAHRHQVRAGETAHPQVALPQQALDQSRRAGLAVRAGDVYDLVRPLRRAEQIHKGRDPAERRLEIPLDAPLQDRAFYRTKVHPSTLLTTTSPPSPGAFPIAVRHVFLGLRKRARTSA